MIATKARHYVEVVELKLVIYSCRSKDMLSFHIFQKKDALWNESIGMIYCNVFPKILLSIDEFFNIIGVGHKTAYDAAVNVLVQG